MGTRRVSFLLKIAKSTGEPLKTVSAVEMKSFREEDGRLVWRGHPVLGDSFTVAVEQMVVAEGVEWGIAYEGNETDWFVEEVSFPEWTVPRTDGTKVFVPRICGMVMAPDWKKAPPRQVMAWQGPGFGAPHCIAVLGEDGKSFYLDQRGEARFHSTRFEIAQGVKPGICVLKSVCVLPITAESRRAYRVPYPSVAVEFRGGWFEAVAIHRDWVRGQDWYKKAASRDFAKLRDVAMWMWNRGRREVTVPPTVKFMKDTALFYDANSDLLFDGEMRAPGRLKCGAERVAFLQRGSYTKPDGVKEVVQDALPVVFHSVWRSKKGRTAAVLVNWSRKEQAYSLEAPDVASRGTIPARSWIAVESGQRR